MYNSNMYITVYLLLLILDSMFNVVYPESHCHHRVISPDSEVSILYSTVLCLISSTLLKEKEQNKKPFYDITFVTQTTYTSSFLSIDSSLRLFYFNYLLTRWHGYIFYQSMNYLVLSQSQLVSTMRI